MGKYLLLTLLIFSHINLFAQSSPKRKGVQDGSNSKSQVSKTEKLPAPAQAEEPSLHEAVNSQDNNSSSNSSSSVSKVSRSLVNSGKVEYPGRFFNDPVYFIILVDTTNVLSMLALDQLLASGTCEVYSLAKAGSYYVKVERTEGTFFKKAFSSLFFVLDEKDLRYLKGIYPFFGELKTQLAELVANPDLNKRKEKFNKSNSKL